MKQFLWKAMLVLWFPACSPHSHEGDLSEQYEVQKFQYTAYSDNLEVFAEGDAFVKGKTTHVLTHVTSLTNFKPVEEGILSLVLTVDGLETRKTLEKPLMPGVYAFDILPETVGKGSLRFEIDNRHGHYEVMVNEVTVFSEDEAARDAAGKVFVPKANAAVFTKEQSWKVDFATGYPHSGPFGPVIKTTAMVKGAPGSERVVTARSSGVLLFSVIDMFEGIRVEAGQDLFTISGNGFVENNIVKYTTAKSNFEKAKADYERARELAEAKVLSEREWLSAKNLFETTKAVYENLADNVGETGQIGYSPLSGYVKQVMVTNGSYVEAGQSVLVVSQNRTLVLQSEIPQRYAYLLESIESANIISPNDPVPYSLEQLNGRVVSYGKAANPDNFLLPVILQIDNPGNFLPGTFVEVYLKTLTHAQALTVPLTAILEEQGNYFVWVQITPERFEKREVHVGETDGVEMEIVEGLSPQERIVTRGAMLIKLAQATGLSEFHSGHVH